MSNKVYVLPANEDWIIDRFVKEWLVDNVDITVENPNDAGIIWILADFCWQRVPLQVLQSKKVLVTVHHIVPEKFDHLASVEFAFRDQIVDAYHVPNAHTEAFIRPLTQKPIHVIPYWANQLIWRRTGEREALRKRYGLPVDGYLVGSFQRDTEGHDLKSPKLEKGPDLLADALISIHEYTKKSLHVVLAGWRRQYIMNRLTQHNVPFSYFEKPSQEVINELYQTLNLYPVSARYEGGPQSLIECGLLGIPVISRPVGMAEQLLPASAISESLASARAAIPNVEHLMLPNGYAPYRKLIEEL